MSKEILVFERLTRQEDKHRSSHSCKASSLVQPAHIIMLIKHVHMHSSVHQLQQGTMHTPQATQKNVGALGGGGGGR